MVSGERAAMNRNSLALALAGGLLALAVGAAAFALRASQSSRAMTIPLPTAISIAPLGANATRCIAACVSTEPAATALIAQPSPTAIPASTAFGLSSPLVGKAVAFVSTRDGESHVFVAEDDGTNIVRVDTPGPAYNPAWSPDGTRLAVTVQLAGQLDVFVTDGITLTNLTENPANDSSPAWSPDGTRIAFQSNRDGDFDLYLLDVSTRRVEQLTDETTRGEVFDGFPAWSPDGTRIAFSSNVAGPFDLRLLDLSTRATTRLRVTTDAGSNLFPAWSPDGSQIAFQSDRSGIDQLMVVGADGSGLRQITDGANPARHPAWLPDGRLMYESVVAADLDLFTLAPGPFGSAGVSGQSLPFIALPGSLEYDAEWKR
jgi:Tol biopolymer transport system component